LDSLAIGLRPRACAAFAPLRWNACVSNLCPLIAEYFIDKAGLPHKAGVPFAAPLRVGWAVPKGKKEMEPRLSSAVQNFLKGNQLKVIFTRWFGYDVNRRPVSHFSTSR